MRRDIRVLVIAELCNPSWASVPLVGWKHTKYLAKHTDLSLLTHQENEKDIKPYSGIFSCIYIKNKFFDFIFHQIVQKLFHGEFGSATLTFVKIPFYFLFELKAIFILLRGYKKKSWQIVHRITPVSPVIASPIAIICRILKIPFVIGPLNGGLPWPDGYNKDEKSFLSHLRWIYNYDPFVFLTRLCAQRILCGSYHTMREVPHRYSGKCHYVPENGIENDRIIEFSKKNRDSKLRCVFVGRMVPLKSPKIAAKACWPFLLSQELTIDFFGDGPERPSLEKEFKHKHCVFHGWISSQEDLVQRLEDYDVLVFPSIKEFGGGVVIECMAKGLVPIVMNYGGPGEIVDESSGYRLPIRNEEQTILDMRATLKKLLSDQNLLNEKSKGAIKRIQSHYTWEKKTQGIIEMYQELIHD